MGDLSAHFSISEMRCHCCERCSVDGRLIDALETLRSMGSEPIDVLDACRCTKHNQEVGGVGKSAHLFWAEGTFGPAKACEAADIRIVGLTVKQMYERAEVVGAFKEGGIGIYDGGFIHVDVRKGEARWARVKGKYVSIDESGLLNAH